MSTDEDQTSLSERLRLTGRALGMVWRTNRLLTIGLGVVTLVCGVLPAGVTISAKQIIDGVLTAIDTGAASDERAVYFWIVVVAGLSTALVAAKRLLALWKSLLYAELGYGVSDDILAKTTSLSLRQIEDPEVQEQLRVARRDATSKPFNLVNRILGSLQALVGLLTFGAILFQFSFLACLVVGVAAFPLFAVETSFSGKAYRVLTGKTPEVKERTYLESILTRDAFAKERLHYRLDDYFMRQFRVLFDKHFEEDRQLQKRAVAASILLGLLSTAAYIGVYYWIVSQTLDTKHTIGEMTMYLAAFRQSQAQLTTLLKTVSDAWGDMLYVSRLFDFFDLEAEDWGGTRTEGEVPGAGIEFDDVTFMYPTGKRPALKNVSFTLRPGERMAIVGANGSGKTTLIKLLLGLYIPTSGRVLLDGSDIREWDSVALRRRFGVIFQSFTKYKLGLGINIGAGDGERIDDPDAWERAAELGMVNDFVDDLTSGFDTRVGKGFPGSVDLSGGQWQRIALARAYFRPEADILILDEPTSAIDPKGEAALFERVSQNDQHDMTILISHRLSTVRIANRILLMHKGEIVEEGSHAELMEREGDYADLFELQAAGYKKLMQAS